MKNLKIQKDSAEQSYVEWKQGNAGYKRAWIQRRSPEKDWANCPEARYLNVVRIESLGSGPAGNATDFPVYSDLTDEQILLSFVHSVCAITGCPLD